MEYHEASLASLDLLRVHGFRVSIDDFGSGYSSLSKIAHLPVHAIKIDREFVAGLPADEKKGKIIQTILSLASSLELTVVAEGVETQAQLAFLRERGCQVFQGFLFSEARPASGFALTPGQTLPQPA
jgi:EAL domain-containing protein (putative c-di-GMP-specific phosphodiesterase class I)